MGKILHCANYSDKIVRRYSALFRLFNGLGSTQEWFFEISALRRFVVDLNRPVGRLSFFIQRKVLSEEFVILEKSLERLGHRCIEPFGLRATFTHTSLDDVSHIIQQTQNWTHTPGKQFSIITFKSVLQSPGCIEGKIVDNCSNQGPLPDGKCWQVIIGRWHVKLWIRAGIQLAIAGEDGFGTGDLNQ